MKDYRFEIRIRKETQKSIKNYFRDEKEGVENGVVTKILKNMKKPPCKYRKSIVEYILL